MTAILLFWMAEFVLESIGAIIYSTRNRMLAVLLAFCAVSDAITFSILRFVSSYAYAWSYWASRSLKYTLLVWLGCSICGMFVAEKRKSIATLSAAFLSLGSAAMITTFAASGETLKDKLLDGEIAANMILLAIMFVGWISRRDRLDSTWKLVALGFMVMVGSDLLFTVLWTFWDGARHWYPLGTIAAQLIWVTGPLKAKLGEAHAYIAKMSSNQRKHSEDVTTTIERLIARTANNSYGKAQRTMARRIINELRRTQ